MHRCPPARTFAALPATTSIALAIALLSAGCIGREVASLPPRTSSEAFQDIPIAEDRRLDLLFVIDDSGSMQAEQTSLGANFPRFIERLEEIEGGLPDVQIGVVSTNVGAGNLDGCAGQGDNGVLQSQPRLPDCQGPSGRFIENRPDGGDGRITNYPAEQSLADTFGCIARLGTGGCGFEQPLESMLRALDGGNPENAGFVREGAFLGVVFITDEDDCSTRDPAMFDDVLNQDFAPSFRCFEQGVRCDPDAPFEPGIKNNCEPRDGASFMYDVSRYTEFLRSLKASDDRLFVAAIVGAPEPVVVHRDGNDDIALRKSCGEIAGDRFSGAVPATRIEAFLRSFVNSTVSSICDADLRAALDEISRALALQIGTRCLQGALVDADLDEPGVQPTCEVSQRFTDGREEKLLACDDLENPEQSTNQPCYVIAPGMCPENETGLEIQTYPREPDVPPDTRLIVRCLVE